MAIENPVSNDFDILSSIVLTLSIATYRMCNLTIYIIVNFLHLLLTLLLGRQNRRNFFS